MGDDDGFEEVVRNTRKRREGDITPLGTARSGFDSHSIDEAGMALLVSYMHEHDEAERGNSTFTTISDSVSSSMRYINPCHTSAGDNCDGHTLEAESSFVIPSCPTQQQNRPQMPVGAALPGAVDPMLRMPDAAIERLAVVAADDDDNHAHNVPTLRYSSSAFTQPSSPKSLNEIASTESTSFARKPLYGSPRSSDHAHQFHCSLADSVGHTTPNESCVTYILDMIRHVAEPLHIRGKQGRLTLWEATEHFDIVNDLIFICRVARAVTMWNDERIHGHQFSQSSNAELARKEEIGSIVLYGLLGIWVVSVAAYCFRSKIIYHRIDARNLTLFCPFVVFWKIYQVGEESPENLYMFERLSWTYQVLMRAIEDIPQVIASAVFSTIYGADTYTCFMISWSAMLMLLTSYRMGVMYPVVGTASLLFSRQPPVDTPHLREAAHTTRGFAVFLAFTFVVWSISNLACLRTVSGVLFMWFAGMQIGLALLAVICICYHAHLRQQASLDITLGENLYPTSPGNDSVDTQTPNSPGVVELQNVQKVSHTSTTSSGEVSYAPLLSEVEISSCHTEEDEEQLLDENAETSLPLDNEEKKECSDGCLTVRDEFPSPSRGVGQISAQV